MANIEGFLPIRNLDVPKDSADDQGCWVTHVKDATIQKLAKQQLFKGGITNFQLLAGGSQDSQGAALNYHDIIL